MNMRTGHHSGKPANRELTETVLPVRECKRLLSASPCADVEQARILAG